MQTSTLAIGARVRFTRNWLQSTCSYTGPVPQLRGIVTELRPFGGGTLATVLWDGPAYFSTPSTNVLACNLEVCRQ